MRFLLLAVQTFVISALAAPTVFKRQEIANEGGDSVSGGPAAVSNPNVNNGQQIDSSLITSGSDGENTFANVFGSSFTKVNSNSANKDNIVINPSITTVNGNSGETANGVGNNIGDSQQVVPGFFGMFGKRDAIVTGGVLDDYHPVQPVFFGVEPAFVHPAFVYPVAGAGSINHQNAAIIQNQGGAGW
ncbi:hypothetical protein J3B02_004498 [Coemansia erecta]|uniref:Uncharacterized protein n=1 Tax=Coemansia asiatica TaxID=1052880 RepID=A0A9W7XIM3_9FUNG|nr:hypothetical protein LPJ64_004654 [Coemansia asiatica]KAJ2846097.1 hypothetical protein J3B02_004498 [Coemansia erecta]KAJ2866896.1 hypothetical protein FB639_004989 [Coemansia asiatica]